MRKDHLVEVLRKNAVTVMFVLLCLGGMLVSGQTTAYVTYELFGRLARNAFLVLALIIPIVAGMGINFAVTIGAMAAQIAALWVVEWGVGGIWRLPFGSALYVVLAAVVVVAAVMLIAKKTSAKKGGIVIAVSAALCLLYQIPAVAQLFSMVQVPMATFMVIGALCLFNVGIMRTRLGQQFRAVGQNRTVANAAGINVDRVRVIAIMISTVLAGWGQLIFVQNMGSFQTYGAHEQVGLYAGAAILVGGASIKRATNSQALLGCILFHLLFIVAPSAGKNLFGDAAIGEYFRVFVSYGVIAMALVMHAWSGLSKKKSPKV